MARTRRKKTKSKTKSFFSFMLVAGFIFGLCFGAGAWVTNKIITAGGNQPVFNEDEIIIDGNRTNILILGVDARPGEEKARSDTMILASIDPKLNKIALVSIPRDTRYPIKGGHLDKICVANFAGGPEYAVEVVEDLMGVKIDHYVLMDFKGFENIVDTIGGVNMTVSQRMYKPSEGINLYPGPQKLNGKDALAFVRFRDYVNGDIQRVEQQQKFLIALADEILKPKTLTKLPSLARQFNQFVQTDIGVTDMLKMASWAPGFSSDSIITQTLPGYFWDQYDENGRMIQSYWIADKNQAKKVIANMFEGKTIAVLRENPNPTPIPVTEPEPEVVEEPYEIKKPKDKNNNNIDRGKLPSPGHN